MVKSRTPKGSVTFFFPLTPLFPLPSAGLSETYLTLEKPSLNTETSLHGSVPEPLIGIVCIREVRILNLRRFFDADK